MENKPRRIFSTNGRDYEVVDNFTVGYLIATRIGILLGAFGFFLAIVAGMRVPGLWG